MTLIQSFKWDLYGNLSHHLVGFIISVVLARSLGPSEYGVVAMSLVLILLFEAIINIGLNSAVIKIQNTTEEQYHTVFTINLIISVILFFIFLTIGPPLTTYFFDNKQVGNATRFLCWLFLAFGAQLLPEALLKKELKFAHLAKAKVLSSAAAGAVAITMALKGYGFYSLIAQHFVFNFGKTILYFYFSQYRPRLRLSNISEFWAFGRPIYLSHLLYVLFNQLDNIIISKLYDVNTLGLFHRAKSLANLLVRYTSGSLSNIMFPYIARTSKVESSRGVLILMLEIVNILSFLLYTLLFVNSQDIVEWLYTSEWLGVVPLLKLILTSVVFYPTIVVGESILKGLGYAKEILRLEVIKKIGFVIVLTLGFYFGLEEYLIGTIILTTFTFIMLSYKVLQVTDVSGWHFLISVIKTLLVTILTLVLISTFFEKIVINSIYGRLAVASILTLVIVLTLQAFVNRSIIRYIINKTLRIE